MESFDLYMKAVQHIILPNLKPLVRAYILGYASNTTPRLISLCLAYVKGKKKNHGDRPGFLKALYDILKVGFQLQRFPTFCATLVGSYKILKIIVGRLVSSLNLSLPSPAHSRITRFISAFFASWCCIKILYSKKSSEYTQDVVIETPDGQVTKKVELAGRTIDMTLNAVTRALDVTVGFLWSLRKRRSASRRDSKFEKWISNIADPTVFATSCAFIMFNFIYTDRLPRSYNNWIMSAAKTDMRLLKALRLFREGKICYGSKGYRCDCLEEMCKEFNWPVEWSDTSKFIPVPCHLMHLNDGHNCEYHAIARLVRSFFWALSTYIPLNLVLVTRNPSRKALVRAIKSAVRSSAFLGTFISFFYYGLCLVRTRIGPRIVGPSNESLDMLDSGLGIGAGCALCGWSVLIENPRRRSELSLFVAPKAVGTIFPRKYPMEKQWIESLAFATSIAVLFTAVSERPNKVRGLMGRILHSVLVQ